MNHLPKIDQLKSLIESHRPLNDGELRELQKWYRISMTYHSNAIEGSTLTEDETRLVIEDGVTIGGKAIREIKEALNHADLVDKLYTVVKSQLPLAESLVQSWHKTLLQGIDEENAGTYRQVKISISGTDEVFPNSKDVPSLMSDFYKWLSSSGDIHPVTFAAQAHFKFVKIHPYIDGNGRIARLLMNVLLMQSNYPPTVIPIVTRSAYMQSLKKSPSAFESFIAETVYENAKDYCRMLEIKF